MPIGAAERRAWCATLVQPRLVLAKRSASARQVLNPGGAELALLFALAGGLLLGLAAYLLLEPPLSRATDGGTTVGEEIVTESSVLPIGVTLASRMNAICMQRIDARTTPDVLVASPPKHDNQRG